MHLRLAPLALAALALPTPAHAAPVWVGDLETGDLSQWSGQLNGDVDGMTYINVTGEQVVQGAQAVKIELHNDAVWPNGLKRVELNHSPGDGRTAEGAVLYFAWSFYLPETLPSDPSQQIGYWESNQSYQQMMAFEISGERMSFSTRQPSNVIHWDQDGVATAGVWHRVAMRIAWSKDPALGAVDVWFDGEQVVTAGAAKTLADDNNHFTQVGLLRGQVEFQDVPTIYIDDAVEGDNLEDVHPDLDPPDETTTTGDPTSADTGDTGDTASSPTTTFDPPGTTGAADESSGASGTTTIDDSSDTSTPDPTPTTGGTTTAPDLTTTTTPIDDGDDDKGCGCDTTPSGPLAALLLLALPRRRRTAG